MWLMGHVCVNLILFICLLGSERKLDRQISIDEWLTIVNKLYVGNQVFV